MSYSDTGDPQCLKWSCLGLRAVLICSDGDGQQPTTTFILDVYISMSFYIMWRSGSANGNRPGSRVPAGLRQSHRKQSLTEFLDKAHFLCFSMSKSPVVEVTAPGFMYYIYTLYNIKTSCTHTALKHLVWCCPGTSWLLLDALIILFCYFSRRTVTDTHLHNE